MPKKMILPIAFIIMTLFFVIKGFIGRFQDDQTGTEQQDDSIETIQEKREYDLKLKACIEQQNDYHESLEAKGQLYTFENGEKTDNSFQLLSAECKMMIIRWEKESENRQDQPNKNSTADSS